MATKKEQTDPWEKFLERERTLSDCALKLAKEAIYEAMLKCHSIRH